VHKLQGKVAQSAEGPFSKPPTEYGEQGGEDRYAILSNSSRQRQAISQTREALENAAAGAGHPKDWQTMHSTHIHKPQYASPGMGHLRHRTVDQGNRTPIMSTSHIMPATADVDLEFNKEGITNDR